MKKEISKNHYPITISILSKLIRKHDYYMEEIGKDEFSIFDDSGKFICKYRLTKVKYEEPAINLSINEYPNLNLSITPFINLENKNNTYDIVNLLLKYIIELRDEKIEDFKLSFDELLDSFEPFLNDLNCFITENTKNSSFAIRSNKTSKYMADIRYIENSSGVFVLQCLRKLTFKSYIKSNNDYSIKLIKKIIGYCIK